MGTLKWYSGGVERGKQAESIINDILGDLKKELGHASLKKVLQNYLKKLEQRGAAVPMFLSQMNLDISKAIRNDGVTLSDYQSKKLKELISISNIRYGY
ncbi:hypothetical protein ATZ33_05945 [Enterococcus silesiacus]|uniref:Bacteriocin immunity protein n=1 Tax=Enterococcus silesiacus TaxID=332949 RepID=A0A0S3K9K1_9ENTE|nr:bacteriocin immunity protein [Enterococcus silesiacus]ALS00926.1 hypothetical protein ATZ33_05945 [Enterococcus silesiacus]OJG91673.1 hypothetical protein RV15_GL000557 [Enterococcus silesiacus]